MCVCVFVTPIRRNYCTDLVKIWNEDRLYSGLKHKLLFIPKKKHGSCGKNRKSRGRSRGRPLVLDNVEKVAALVQYSIFILSLLIVFYTTLTFYTFFTYLLFVLSYCNTQ